MQPKQCYHLSEIRQYIFAYFQAQKIHNNYILIYLQSYNQHKTSVSTFLQSIQFCLLARHQPRMKYLN